MKPTITSQEANEMMYNLSIKYMENIKYHMESLENIRPEDEYTPMDLLLATIKVAKVFLVKMEALASVLNIKSYSIDLGGDAFTVDLDTSKPTVKRVLDLIDRVEGLDGNH